MKDNVIITINEESVVIPKGCTILELLKKVKCDYPVIAAKINGELEELSFEINEDCKVDYVTARSRIGIKIYTKGLQFVYICAVKELYGEKAVVRIKHSIDKAVYTELKIGKDVNQEIIKEIINKMKDIVAEDHPIRKISVTRKNAIEYFMSVNEREKAKNLLYSSDDYVTLYELLDTYNDFFYTMPHSTGILELFDLEKVNGNGVVLKFPIKDEIPEYHNVTGVLDVFRDYSDKLKKLGISYVCDVNDLVCKGKIDDFIQICEMIYDEGISKIANSVDNDKNIKLVLIAGPSSSGKTTSSKKLKLSLKTKGLDAFLLSTDDYFLDRGEAKPEPDGSYDYEKLEAIDTKLFNEHLEKLVRGESVVLPKFNFFTGEKEFKGKPTKIDSTAIIIVEGLHALNDEVTKCIDKTNKYKIYISPFTPLSIDRHNHLSTVDLRFIRRLVRDFSHRGYGAEETLSRWKKMRRSEEKYIYPYQNVADVILNTTLFYELGVLQIYARPLLYSVKPDSENYEETIRIINFLRGFMSIPDKNIPKTSVLREFIGGSYFE